MGKYLPCLRCLFTPSAGSGEEALSLTEDMAEGPSTSFHVHIGHGSAFFSSNSRMRFQGIVRRMTIAEGNETINATGQAKKFGKLRTAGSDPVGLTWMRRRRLCNSKRRLVGDRVEAI